ncbi:P-type DNA transfer ATPase VirB11 [Thaumasiovibrio subtropicus]|uniref:P-type DNA transfer ATPase VirB11 n=1 Tax=Thaumasiovibrio subtropicus TaxID=1891207 RepID=UPI000B34DAEB|nr:P-type DNA transfer ATPase VirB11 [Thaumasiovibrio subtropicus]
MHSEFDKSTTIRTLLAESGLQAILDTPGLTELAINEPYVVLYDTGGDWQEKRLDMLSYDFLSELCQAFAVFNNLSVDEGIFSIKLPDGERGQVVMPPVTQDGIISMTIRKPSLDRFDLASYQSSGRFAFTQKSGEEKECDINSRLSELKAQGDIAGFFRLAVESNKNILLVGGTGSGKTTVMKAMVDCYPTSSRLITVEDVHELSLPNHPNHVHLFYRKNTPVTPKLLIESCMRMKPDHVLLAELRGDETWTYLELLNTGHAGSITTVHANSSRDAYARITSLIKQSPVGMGLEYEFINRTVKESIDVVAFFKRTHLTELIFTAEEEV